MKVSIVPAPKSISYSEGTYTGTSVYERVGVSLESEEYRVIIDEYGVSLIGGKTPDG